MERPCLSTTPAFGHPSLKGRRGIADARQFTIMSAKSESGERVSIMNTLAKANSQILKFPNDFIAPLPHCPIA